jgi:predicted AlkP superfamily phosphohydrolase/phosphomutase
MKTTQSPLPTPHSALPTPHCSRVLVIGLDGATYDVLTPLAEMGVMPNLAALMRSSALAQLTSTEPYTTPVAWASFQTGCDVEGHGIWDYRYLDHALGEVLLNHAGRIACPTLFDAVWAAGGEVVSLNLPMTFPPRPGRAGIIVGGLDSPSAEAALAPYPRLAERLRSRGVDYSIDTIWKRKPQSFAELSQGVGRTIADFRSRAAAAQAADALSDWRLMVVQFQTLDSLQHRCWHLLDLPLPPGEGRGEGQSEDVCSSWVAQVHSAFRALDRCLGDLLDLAARRDAAVVVLSDHGFGPFREKICLAELLGQRGLLRYALASQRLSYCVSRAGWKLRKWRHRRQQGSSTASVRRPLPALAPIDWQRSLAFAVHGELSALVYVNDAARFGAGPIATPQQREAAETETIATFREARHARTGEALFTDVYATRERFDCDPIQRQWPDVVAIPAPGFHTRTKFDTPGKLFLDDPTLTGTHRREGVLMIQSPAAVIGQQHVADMRDLAPTILHLLGLSPSSHMTGHVLCDMIGQASPSCAPSCAAPALGVSKPILSHDEQAVVEQRLRELGYLD